MSILLIILAIFILTIFCAWPKIGLYLLILSLPIIGIEINLYNLNIPIVDLIALFLFLSFIINYIFSFILGRKIEKINWPLIIPFSIFLSINLVSVFLANNFLDSFYYFLRWPLFLYLAYIFVPANIIIKPKILKNAIIFLFISSLIVLFSGFISLLNQDIYDSFFRLRGLNLYGFYPFGDNHNLIAEFLNIGIFLSLIIKEFLKEKRLKNIANLIFLLGSFGVILSFSRAAWITFALQLIVYFIYKMIYQKKERVKIILFSCLFLIIISPFFIRMERLQEANIGSTKSRVLLNNIALNAFEQKPLFGHGSGQFLTLVYNDIRFRAQHGEAIDAHGFLPKILAENGIFGLVAWLFILIYLFKISFLSLKRYYPKISWLLPLCLAVWGGLFFQLFNTSYYKGKVWLPILLFFLAIKFLDEIYVKKNKNTSPIT